MKARDVEIGVGRVNNGPTSFGCPFADSLYRATGGCRGNHPPTCQWGSSDGIELQSMTMSGCRFARASGCLCADEMVQR